MCKACKAGRHTFLLCKCSVDCTYLMPHPHPSLGGGGTYACWAMVQFSAPQGHACYTRLTPIPACFICSLDMCFQVILAFYYFGAVNGRVLYYMAFRTVQKRSTLFLTLEEASLLQGWGLVHAFYITVACSYHYLSSMNTPADDKPKELVLFHLDCKICKVLHGTSSHK